MTIDQISANEPARLLPRIRLAVPDRLRALVRGSEVWLVSWRPLVGAVAGVTVVDHERDRRPAAPGCSSASAPATG